MVRQDGTGRDVEAVISNQIDRPSVAGYVANVRDITERKKFEELLSHRALHDPLTGLANRQLILDRADQMLVRSRRSGDPVAAFFVDLDNFKDANDSLGHEAGDRLLQAVASRLVGLLRTSDTVGRLGGDEFVVLAEGVSLRAGPEAIAERIRQVLRPAFYVEGFESFPLYVSASIGIAVGDRPRPRTCCATPTSPCTGPRAPDATRRSCSRRPCSWPPTTGSRCGPNSTRPCRQASSPSSTNPSWT